MKAKTVDMQRRGNVSMMVLTSLGAVLATGAVVIDLGFAWVVRQQLRNTVDAAAMAAAMEIDGTDDGLAAARAAARHIGGVNLVNGHGRALTDHQIIFGEYDAETKTFEPSDDPLLIDAVRVVGLERKVGLGMARIAWGRDGVDVYATAGVLAGAGTANDGSHDEWGLVGGHFDVDVNTKQALPNKADTNGHIHEYDNKYDVTSYDVLAPRDPGKLAPMQNKVAGTRRFKLIAANADLSRGGCCSSTTRSGASPSTTTSRCPICPSTPSTAWPGASSSGTSRSTSTATPSDPASCTPPTPATCAATSSGRKDSGAAGPST